MCMSSQNRTLQHVQDSAESDSAVLCRTESQSTHRRVRLFGALQNQKSINSPQSQTLWCSAEPKVNQLTAEADSAVLHAEPRINQLTAEADSAVLCRTQIQSTHCRGRLRGALHNLESSNSPQSQTPRCSTQPGINQLTAESDSAVLGTPWSRLTHHGVSMVQFPQSDLKLQMCINGTASGDFQTHNLNILGKSKS